MPMMRDTPPPLPADVVRELRSTLAPSYGHKLVNHEGKLVLAIRVPHEVPDRERDLACAVDHIPEDEAALARDVLFIGAEKMFRLDPIPLRDLVRERLRDDVPVSKEVRRGMAREFGAALFNPATRRDLCIALRVPRASYRDCTPEDLVAMQRAVEQVFAQPKAGSAGMCYLVADNDYRRMPLEEFVRTLRGEVALKPPKVNNYVTAGDSRGASKMANASSFSGSPFGMLVTQSAHTDAKMEANKAKAKQAPPAPPAAPAPPVPAAPVQVQVNVPVPSPFQAPAHPGPATVVASVLSPIVPALQLQPPPMVAPEPVAAPEPAPAEVAPAAQDPVLVLGSRFAGAGFEVLTDVADLGLVLAAHRPDGKRLIVQRVPEATEAAVQALTAKCTELEAHAGVLVCDAMAPGAWLAAAGTPVVLLPAPLAEAISL